MLGEETTEIASQLLIALYTDDIAEAAGWMPEGQIYADFLVLLRVYLGWRYKAKITLTLPTPLLPAPVWRNAVYARHKRRSGHGGDAVPPDLPATFTTELGGYRGMPLASLSQGNQRVEYHFA